MLSVGVNVVVCVGHVLFITGGGARLGFGLAALILWTRRKRRIESGRDVSVGLVGSKGEVVMELDPKIASSLNSLAITSTPRVDLVDGNEPNLPLQTHVTASRDGTRRDRVDIGHSLSREVCCLSVSVALRSVVAQLSSDSREDHDVGLRVMEVDARELENGVGGILGGSVLVEAGRGKEGMVRFDNEERTTGSESRLSPSKELRGVSVDSGLASPRNANSGLEATLSDLSSTISLRKWKRMI